MKEFAGYAFSRRERVYNILGLTILLIAAITALIGYGLGFLFTGEPWLILSPGIQVAASAVGIVLVWLGSGNAMKRAVHMIDASLSRFGHTGSSAG